MPPCIVAATRREVAYRSTTNKALFDRFGKVCEISNVNSRNTLAPPGNIAANGENKHQHVESGEAGLVDSVYAESE
jgi:hypothetical protein